jgi:hypothetical protein
MPALFVIEDEAHAEKSSEHPTLSEAMARLKELADIPWDQEPNAPPCTNWRTCERRYEVVEYETSGHPWKELCRTPVLKINAEGVVWESGFEEKND